MQATRVYDKHVIERHLRENVYLNLYGIGDLDDFFWPHTTWYATRSGSEIDALVLLYSGLSTPTLLAFSPRTEAMRGCLRAITPLLPSRFYAHLSPELESVFAAEYTFGELGDHYKMALQRPELIDGPDTTGVVPLGTADTDAIRALYDESYPENWFDSRMLETGQYFGWRDGTRLVSIAGIHVYSARYRVAALGNITTRPSHRGRGYAARTTAEVCRSLRKTVEHIGMNVKVDNAPAIACYRRLGFEVVASFGEFLFERRGGDRTGEA